MVEWRRIPPTLWLFSAVALAETVLVEIQADGPVAAKVLFGALMLGWIYLLLHGMRWVWLLTVGISVLGLVSAGTGGSLEWPGLALTLAGLVFLLLPATRYYYLHPHHPV
jgi:hypothetical protein